MADFFDVMQLGEGEQMLQDICAAVERGKKQGWNKEQLLLELAKIPGVYVPSFYDVTYREDGRIEAVTPNRPGVPARVTKAPEIISGQRSSRSAARSGIPDRRSMASTFV